MPKQDISRQLTAAVALFTLLSLFINLGVQPTYVEEPRRALIAMEMAEAGNWIVPRQLGAFYYRKPPVFNWLLMVSAELLGGYSRWAIRLPTVLSLIASGLLLYLVGRRQVNEEFGRFWALLYIFCGAIYFFFSLLGEIDLFYSLVTLSSFLAFFHFHQRGRYTAMFLSVYGLAAVGLLTKGLPAIPFLGITVLVWLYYERQLKLLLSWAHVWGVLLFMGVVGGYIALYAQYNTLINYWGDIFGQTADRTLAHYGWLDSLIHFFYFPLDILQASLPSSLLLLLFATHRKLWSQLKRHKLLVFCAIVFLANLLPYWFSPGTRQRYIYMLYPLMLAVGLYAWQQRGELATWRERAFRYLVGGLLVLSAVGCLALNFVPAFDFLPARLWISVLGSSAFVCIAALHWRMPQYALHWLCFGLIAARLVFAFTVLPQRAYDSAAQFNTDLAVRIHEEAGDAPLYLYEGGRISYTVIYKLNRLRGETVRFSDTLAPGTYMILPAEQFPQYEPLLHIPFHDNDFKLVEIP